MLIAFSHMLWPLLACLVLVGIHAYLGIHVIARKVIFVDLALAQIAALGTVYGVFLGLSIDADQLVLKGVSVVFTLLGALLFSFTRTSDERLPHEAIIGIIYAAALSATIMLTANLPHGADEVRQLLAGNILWITPQEVLFTALLYIGVGLIHVVFRRQFLMLSGAAHGSGISLKLWDFLFYATFGVVVTSSVAMGGVLLVFGYLVIPSVIGIMLAASLRWRLAMGWLSGTIMSIAGVVLSYHLDLPSGPTIVVLLAGLLLIIALWREMGNRHSRLPGLFHAILILFVLLILAVLPTILQLHEIESHDHPLGSRSDGAGESLTFLQRELSSADDIKVLGALGVVGDKGLRELLPLVLPKLAASSDKIREAAVSAIRSLGDERAGVALLMAAKIESDVFIRIEMADALLSLGRVEGFMILREIASEKVTSLAVVEALERIEHWLIEMPTSPSERLDWLRNNIEKLLFDRALQKYYVGSGGDE